MEFNEEMQRFLVYSVFGDALECKDELSEVRYNEYLIKKCVKLAYLDLCRVIPYRISSAKLDKDKNNKVYRKYKCLKDRFYHDIERIIEDYINSNNSDFFSKNIIEDVIIKAEEYYHPKELFDSEFTCGMAQKWVNMTLKYLWLFGKCPLKDTNLDVPIDSYILDVVWMIKDIRNGLQEHFNDNLELIFEDKKMDWEKEYKRPSEGMISWSHMSKETYSAIQETIKNYCNENDYSPMKWENDAWIRRASERNK